LRGDGNLWFTEADGNKIGRITPTGTITEFPVPTAVGYPTGITAGPDGNLWFVESMSNKIGRITPTGTFAEFPIPTPKCGAADITVGPDGALWFSEGYVQKLGRITTAGAITELQLPAPGAWALATGSDGALWYTSNNAPTIVGRVTLDGQISTFSVSSATQPLLDITPGPDGNLWFTNNIPDLIGRVTPAGVVTEFSSLANPGPPTIPPSTLSAPNGIVAGPDGNLWFTCDASNTINRIAP
jgi:virginiamycin B lyase